MKKKNKIVFVISDLDIGGAQKILLFLANFLEKKGFQIKILYFENKISIESNKEINFKSLGLNKKTNGIIEKIKYNLFRIKVLRQEIKKIKPDYLISFLTTVNIITLIASFNLKIKIILNERNDIIRKEIPIVWKILRYFLYRFSNNVVTNQPESFHYLKKYIDCKKVLFIPNPYTNKEKYKYKKNRNKNILFVGRLTFQKNIYFLINAFYKSEAIKKGWKLLIFGKGEELNNLKHIIKKYKISNHVYIKGITKEINKWYKKSSIYIICSRYEGMPNSLIESMYYRLAIIGSNIPGIRYYIKHYKNGLLIDNQREDDLIKNLNLLINKKRLRDELGSNAKKYLIKKANPSFFFNKWLRILK